MRKTKNLNTSKDWGEKITPEEIKSLWEGLKDLEESRIYSHETARKIYKRYL